MAEPEFWIVAGPNGAGKTTFIRQLPPEFDRRSVRFFYPDAMTLSLLHDQGYANFEAPHDVQLAAFHRSADQVFAELSVAIDRQQRVGVETAPIRI